MAPTKKPTRSKRPIVHRIAKQLEALEIQDGAREPIETAQVKPEETAPVVPPRLKKRVPIGQRRPLSIDPSTLDPNYEYRNVRGNQTNMQRYLDAGYEFVTDDIQVGDAGLMRGSQTDSRVSVPSGDSQDRLFLMRIPKEFYEEDQAAKQKAIDKKEEGLQPSAEAQGLEGKLNISR